MAQIGSVYILKSNIVLFPSASDIANGIWKAIPPFYKLPKEFNDNLINAINDILDNSKEGLIFSQDYSAKKLLKEKTNLSFNNLQDLGVKNIFVSQEQNKIVFTPSKNIGKNKGFMPLTEKAVIVFKSKSNKEILKLLNEAILLCE